MNTCETCLKEYDGLICCLTGASRKPWHRANYRYSLRNSRSAAVNVGVRVRVIWKKETEDER